MKRDLGKGRRRKRTGVNFFLYALLVAVAIFVVVKIVQDYWPPGGAPRVAHNTPPAIGSAAPPQAASLADFSLVLIRCQRARGCPYYDLHVQADTLAYSGVRDVAKRGNVEVPLAKARKHELLELVRKARFFSLKDSYDLADPGCKAARINAPTFTVGVTLNGATKVVRVNRACANVPPRLIALANGVDRITRSAQWTGVPAAVGATGS